MNWVFEYRYETKYDNCINWFNYYNDNVKRVDKPSENYAFFHTGYESANGVDVSTCFSYTNKKHFMSKVKKVRNDLANKNLKCSELGLKSFDILIETLSEKFPEELV